MATRDYSRDGLTVHWDSQICMHSGVCVKTLPGVFNVKASPWIDVEAADVDRIVEAVDACPSGALSYSRPGDVEVQVSGNVTIHPEENGPLRIDGQVNLIDADGNVVRSGERFFLCRCGHSNSKPFCDGSHRKFGFTS